MAIFVGVGAIRPTFAYDYYYGVEFDKTVAATPGTRLGRAELHVSLPIQNKMKRCVLKDDGTVNYYLSDTDSTKTSTGGNADLTGAAGQVMVEIPKHYRRFEVEGNKTRCLLSEYALPGFTEIPLMYISAYEAAVDRTNSKLASVVNATAQYRGGDNNATKDALASTLLGMPATVISRTTFRTYARARNVANTKWNCYTYEAHKALFWLYTVEYANSNCQAAYNAELTAEGYRQGGLGDGVTNIDGTKWGNFNGYMPFIPCGFTNSLGNKTGVVTFTMPFAYDANGAANYKGEYGAATAYVANDYVSSGALLYKCILASTGNAVTNTTYFTPVTRTTTKVPSYRGIENGFGHIWKWTDGVNIAIQSIADGGLSKAYACPTPANYQDNNYDNYNYIGNLPRSEGYVKSLLFGEKGEMLPLSVGGSATTYWCDYFYTNIPDTGTSLRGLLFGGSALNGSGAGFGSANTYIAPSSTYASFGSRLCFLP